MKNSTQITFAFQDTPDQGENPGVGVRIKSLKKGANERGPAGGNAEDQAEAKKQQDKPAEPRLFDETTPVQATEVKQGAGENQTTRIRQKRRSTAQHKHDSQKLNGISRH